MLQRALHLLSLLRPPAQSTAATPGEDCGVMCAVFRSATHPEVSDRALRCLGSAVGPLLGPLQEARNTPEGFGRHSEASGRPDPASASPPVVLGDASGNRFAVEALVEGARKSASPAQVGAFF